MKKRVGLPVRVRIGDIHASALPLAMVAGRGYFEGVRAILGISITTWLSVPGNSIG